MLTAPEADIALDDFSAALDELTSKPALFERDVERLRHALYRQGGVDRRSAAEIMQANRIMQTSHNGWSEFYLEALSDFFLEYQGDNVVLPACSEEMLLAWLGDGVAIDHVNERRLILRILLKATSTPVLLERRVLDAVKENFLHHSERWIGAGERSKGVVDALDMQLIRRLTHGARGQYPRRSNQAVVSFLVDLEQQVKQFTDREGWRRLLIDCVALHLTMGPMNGCALEKVPVVELKTRIKALFEQDSAVSRSACLQDDILSAMQLC